MSGVVLIGLDGATFAVLDALMQDGTMPFLRELTARGVRRDLLSTVNPLTPSAWCSLTTGRSPGAHGILDFVRFERGEAGAGYFVPTNSQDLACQTIWSIASGQQCRVTALNFYALWPPRPVDGYTMSGFVSWRHMKDATYPPGLYDRVKMIPGFDRKELAKDIETERLCVQGMPLEQYAEWISLYIRKDRQWFSILEHLMHTDPTPLSAIVFEGVDKIQHLAWRFVDPELVPRAPNDLERRVRALCVEYFHQLDDIIRRIVGLAGQSAHVFVTSDHGFKASTEIFYPNVWLHREGFLEWAVQTPVEASTHLTSESLSANVNQFDWLRTQAYAVTSSSNGIWINMDPQSEQYERVRAHVAASLERVVDPETGERIVTSVRTREEAYPGPHRDRAPDLLMTLRDGGFISVLRGEQPVVKRPEPAGTHRREGVFLACGPGIRAGARLEPGNILDVSPTLLYALGLAIPEDIEGHVATEIFEPFYLLTHEQRVAAVESAVAVGSSDEVRSRPAVKSGEAEILRRLRALGYVE